MNTKPAQGMQEAAKVVKRQRFMTDKKEIFFSSNKLHIPNLFLLFLLLPTKLMTGLRD